MKHHSILTFMTVAVCAAVSMDTVGRTASQFFADMPDVSVPLLTRNTRLDMLDYYNSGLETPSANRLDGKSRITSVTPSRVDISMSTEATASLVVIPFTKGDTILAYVETSLLPVPDSHVTTFRVSNGTLERLETLTPPPANDWLIKKTKADEALLRTDIPMFFVSVEPTDDPSVLRLVNTTSRNFIEGEVPDVLSRTSSERLFSVDRKGRWAEIRK